MPAIFPSKKLSCPNFIRCTLNLRKLFGYTFWENPGFRFSSEQLYSATDASAIIPHKAKGWGQQESKPHSVQRPEERRTAYLCRCDYPWHRPELSCRLAAHEPDARGGCGLPPVLSTLAHGDFPRSVCNRSELLVCQLRSRASRAPRALHA